MVNLNVVYTASDDSRIGFARKEFAYTRRGVCVRSVNGMIEWNNLRASVGPPVLHTKSAFANLECGVNTTCFFASFR